MTISQSEYARRRGVSRQYVSRLVKQGVIVLDNGKIDPARADAALAAVSVRRGRRGAGAADRAAPRG